MSYLYVFSDKGIASASKIGTSSSLESRYRQARCHTPRGISIEAFFSFPDTASARLAEASAKRALAKVRRPGDATEWFDLRPREAIERIGCVDEVRVGRRLSEPQPKLKLSEVQYDDWREARDSYAAYKWRMFMFEEQGPERRLKLSYGALYDTAYRYVFTYNAFPVRLVAGFEHPSAPEYHAAENAGFNAHIAEAWRAVQNAHGSLFAEEVGWLRLGVNPATVASVLSLAGIKPFDLTRPKPAGTPPREASMNPPTPVGAAVKLNRVQMSPEVYR